LWHYLLLTKQEVKYEMRQSEGDPHVKGRIRKLQREMAKRRMMQEVPKADVVITNPTHVAVAIRYDRSGTTG
jgi:flagellar biosynthesis protein FlhB